MSTRRVTITPRINLRMSSSGRSYCGRWSGWGASFVSAAPGFVQLTDAWLRSAEPSGFAQGRLAAGFAHYVANLGQIVLFLRGREWDRRIQACDADDRAVEVVKSFFVDDGGDFAGKAS